MAELVIQTGKHRGKRLQVTQKDFIIGREEGCAIRLASADISKRHCAVRAKNDTLLVRDLGSRNGTYLNDVLVTEPTLAEPGDVLRVGPMSFLVSKSTGKAKAANKPAKPAAKKDDGLSDDDIAGWLTDENGEGGNSGDTTEIPNAAEDPNKPRLTEKQQNVREAAAAVIRKWHETHSTEA